MILYLVYSSQASSIDFERINRENEKCMIPFLFSYYNHSNNFDKCCLSLTDKKIKMKNEVKPKKKSIYIKKKKGLGLIDL